MIRRNRFRLVYSLGLAVLLAGCGNDGMNDLREFVATAHAGRQPRVEPLPEVKPQEQFVYAAVSLVDPFAVFGRKATTTTGSGPRPDMNRRREPLEEFPLDSLKMVGTLGRGKQSWAVIEAPDGTVHRVGVGNHLGQNFGKILRISDEKISLIELVQAPLGDWVEREASVALNE